MEQSTEKIDELNLYLAELDRLIFRRDNKGLNAVEMLDTVRAINNCLRNIRRLSETPTI